MSANSQDLKALAGLALKIAAQIDGQPVPSGFDVNDPRSWWPAMLAQFANDDKPHEYVAPGTGVLPSQTGTNEPPPRSYDTHRMLWDAAQRGDPVTPGGERVMTGGIYGWPDAEGFAFRIDTFVRLGPDAIHSAIVHLYNSPLGQAWLESVGPSYPGLLNPPQR